MRNMKIELDKGFCLTPEKIREWRLGIEKAMRHFSVYPDVFLDIIAPSSSGMQLYFFQRIYLRACMRYSFVYITAGRGTSKTFLAVLAMILRCVFQPGTKQFICAPGKGQGNKIAAEKITEILEKYPLLKSEILNSHMSNDDIHLWFKNGSEFTVVAALNSERGGRRSGGLVDEVRDHDVDLLNQVVIPLMTLDRRMRNGQINPYEPQHAQIFSTSAASKSSFAYEKMLEILVNSVASPSENFVMQMDFRIPAMHKLVSQKLIQQQRLSSTYKEEDFAREFLSIWTGGSRDSWFNYGRLMRHRKIVNCEKSFTKVVNNPRVFYIIGVDVGRLADNTVITILKVIPNAKGYQKKVVNIFPLEKMHFEEQAARIKQQIELFQAREVIIDGTGVGAGLLDFMIKDNVFDGAFYPAIGSFNDKDLMSKQPKNCQKIMYVLKVNEQINSEIHTTCFSEISRGKVSFLIGEQLAKQKLMASKKGQKMTALERIKFMMPYEMTTRLHDEMCNLKVKQNARVLSLERINTHMRKDKFSSFEYAVWRASVIESETERKRVKSGLSKLVCFS